MLTFLGQTMSLGNTVLQLFCCYYSWCLYRQFQCWIYCTFTLALSAVCVQCPIWLFSVVPCLHVSLVCCPRIIIIIIIITTIPTTAITTTTTTTTTNRCSRSVRVLCSKLTAPCGFQECQHRSNLPLPWRFQSGDIPFTQPTYWIR